MAAYTKPDFGTCKYIWDTANCVHIFIGFLKTALFLLILSGHPNWALKPDVLIPYVPETPHFLGFWLIIFIILNLFYTRVCVSKLNQHSFTSLIVKKCLFPKNIQHLLLVCIQVRTLGVNFAWQHLPWFFYIYVCIGQNRTDSWLSKLTVRPHKPVIIYSDP